MRQGPEASECTGQVAIRRLCCGVVPRYMKPAVWRGSVLGICLCCMDGLNLAGWEMGRVHAWTPNREDWKQEQGTRGGRQREQPSWVRLRQHGYRAVQYFVVHYRTDCTVLYPPHCGRHGIHLPDPHRRPLSSEHRTCYMDNPPCTSGTSYTDDTTDSTFETTRNTSNPQTPQGIVPPLTPPPPRPRTARYNQSASPPLHQAT